MWSMRKVRISNFSFFMEAFSEFDLTILIASFFTLFLTLSYHKPCIPWLYMYPMMPFSDTFVSNSFRTTRFHFIPPIPTFAIIYNHPIVFLAARPKLGTPRSQKRTLKLGRETSDKTICSTDNEKWAWLQFQIESHFLSKALIRASFSSCLTHKSSNWASSKTF